MGRREREGKLAARQMYTWGVSKSERGMDKIDLQPILLRKPQWTTGET